MAEEKQPPFREAADLVADSQDADVLFINAPIYRPLDNKVRELIGERTRRKNLILILVTDGGDADAAFRIARSLQASYEHWYLFVTGFCKSAGTLVAIGAGSLIVSDHGELGPLDVQMTKPDELMQRQSGLTATAALSTLHQQAFQAFEHFFLSLVTKSGNTISTRTATQIAVQFASSLFAPMYGHVDPMHVGEAGRALMIAEQYGQILATESRNLKADALEKLTAGFASHGFVIDRKQIADLFVRVRVPNSNELALARALGTSAQTPSGERPLMAYLSSERPQEQELPGLKGDTHDQTNNASDSATTGDGDQGNGASARQPRTSTEAHLSPVGPHRRARRSGNGRTSQP